jgi:hypothetical protein
MYRLLCCILLLLSSPLVVNAAETCGLRVIAKDPASGQQAEVSLCNKP